MTTAPDPTDQHLDDVAVKQMMFKPGISRDIACRIVRAALTSGSFWPDEVNLDDVPSLTAADSGCRGIAWRNLTRAGIITTTGHFRRSTAKGRHGSKVFQYAIASRALAQTFLRRNGDDFEPQPNLL